MTRTFRATTSAFARMVGLVPVLCAAAAGIALAPPAHAETGTPVPDVNHKLGMYGDPTAAARYWRQQQGSDCGELAVADVVGQITGRQPSAQQIDTVAQHIPNKFGSGPIWKPEGFTNIKDLPTLLWHYWIAADNVQTNTNVLERDLAEGRKIIVLINAETIWNRPGRRTIGDHFVVVTGIDTRNSVVHLNDSGVEFGRNEQIPLPVFEQAWAPNHNSAVVTRRPAASDF
jgi:Peptidase_C39 like family